MFRKALFVAALVVSTSAVSAPPQQFLTDAIKGDNSEAALGRVIAARGYTAHVRSFGRTLTRDHNNARAQAAALARSYGMRPPTSMMPEARTEMRLLDRLRGRAFDREVRRFMVAGHRKNIAIFERQVRNGDRRTSSLARAQLPVLRTHLRIAESIRG
jgi:putative membrane protein